MTEEMTSLERVLTTMQGKEPDRVPLFLLLTMHGAKELGISLEEYFHNPEYVARGQQILQQKYQNDLYSPFYYAAIEVEAWGGTVQFYTDGPPNSGAPFISDVSLIEEIEVPEVDEVPCLQNVIKTIEILSSSSQDTIPIIGVAMSPFSVPVMQMGYDRYLDLLCDDKSLFWKLMKKNQEFCIEWANAQVDAGAHAICYFDPVSSPTSIQRDLFLKTGYKVARETISHIRAPTAMHMASGRCLSIAEDLMHTGAGAIGVSALEDITTLKRAYHGKMTVIGNMNGLLMRKWTPEEAEHEVLHEIVSAAPGGGYILSDNHGEIPYQVPDSVLHTISAAVRKWGTYPIISPPGTPIT